MSCAEEVEEEGARSEIEVAALTETERLYSGLRTNLTSRSW